MADDRVVNMSDYWDGRRRFLPEDVIRIDRKTKWGNPYKIGEPYEFPGEGMQKMTREQVIGVYRVWLDMRLESEPDFIEPLRGKRLGCWCRPDACHGDVILEYLDRTREAAS